MIETKRNISHAAVHVELENCVQGVSGEGRKPNKLYVRQANLQRVLDERLDWTRSRTRRTLLLQIKKKYHMEYVVCTYLVYLIRIRNEMGGKKRFSLSRSHNILQGIIIMHMVCLERK